jgi:hypothetical protein
MNIKELYESLKGTRAIQGELTVPNFTDENYEDLYYYLLEELKEHIGSNYEYWYTKTARAFHKYKARGRNTFDFYDPQYEKPVESQTIREQLATIKFYCQKRAYSRYPRKDIEEV